MEQDQPVVVRAPVGGWEIAFQHPTQKTPIYPVTRLARMEWDAIYGHPHSEGCSDAGVTGDERINFNGFSDKEKMMPGFDKTGPFGNGPYGRGLGPCGSVNAAPFGRRRIFGFGRGGFGWRRNSWPALSPEEETASLEQEKKWLESLLSDIDQRLEQNKKN
jgi:hypothetical protein